MRWKMVAAVPVVLAAGFAATASSATPDVAAVALPGESSPAVPAAAGVVPAEPHLPQAPRGPAGDGGDPARRLPPPAAGGTAVLGEGPLAIPELVFYAYRAAEMQLAVDSPECGLPWHLLAAIGRIGSQHADNGRTDVLGTLVTASTGPDGRLGPMRLAPAVWERFAVDGNADGTADPQNVFDSALAAGTWMCAEGARVREPDGEARAIALFDPSPEYLSDVRHWSGAYAKAADVAPSDLAPAPARPVPPAVDVAAPVPTQVAPAPTGVAATPLAPAPDDTAGAGDGAAPAAPVLPPLPELPCLVPAFCE